MLNSVQFSCSVISDSLWPYGVQHTRLPFPSPSPGVCSNSCPLIESVISSNHFILCQPFLLLPQSSPAWGSFQMNQFFTSGDQSIGASASASVLPMNMCGISVRIDAEAEAPILWSPDVKNWLVGKIPDTGKDWSQEKRVTEDEMVGWHYQLNGHEFEQTPRDSEQQGSLVCCSPWGCKESDVT